MARRNPNRLNPKPKPDIGPIQMTPREDPNKLKPRPTRPFVPDNPYHWKPPTALTSNRRRK